MKKIHLAVDIGSSNGKMVLMWLEEDGTLQSKEVGRFSICRTFFAGHVCTNTYQIYEDICAFIRKLAKEGVEIHSMGIDSWASDFGLVSADGQPLGLPVFYRDKRTNGMPEEIEKIISYEELYTMTSQRRMQDSSLSQLVAQRREDPNVLEGGTKVLFLADLLNFYFSGRICTEITLASYSQMYSMEKLGWEDRVFELFDLPKTLQTEVVLAGEKLGRISDETAAALGTDPFEVIAVASHDTSCAVAAVPARKGEHWAFISTGSWFLAGVELEKPKNLPMCYRFNCSNTGLAFGKTMCKRNIMAMWLFQQCKKAWEEMGLSYSYGEISRMAGEAEAFYGMLDVDDQMFFNPNHMPRAIVEYIKKTGQRPLKETDVGQMARMMYEAIALKCAYAMNCMEKITEEALDVIYVVGGVSGVEIMCQMIASACGKNVVAGVQEASSIGNGLLQAYGCGEISSAEEIREVVRNTCPEKRYEPEETRTWKEKYEVYCKFCDLEQ